MKKCNPPSILLVEDDAGTRDIMANVLSVKFPEFVVHTADNGRAALECYRKYLSPIVITDINMPLMDGISTAREIKAINADVKLIVLTAFSDKSLVMYTEAIEIEIDHYIQKPTDYGKLFAAVELCIAAIAPDGVLPATPPSPDEKPEDSNTAKEGLKAAGTIRERKTA